MLAHPDAVQHRFYDLTPASLQSIVLESLATARAADTTPSNNASLIISTLLDQLVEKHPEMSFNTDFRDKSEWVFNNAGGAMGSMFIIHASITESVTLLTSRMTKLMDPGTLSSSVRQWAPRGTRVDTRPTTTSIFLLATRRLMRPAT